MQEFHLILHIYIQKKKIMDVINKNKWLKVKSVVILYDKSDIADNTGFYTNQPKNFPIEKKVFKNRKKEKLIDDFKKLQFITIFTEQTISGIFLREIIGGSVEDFFKIFKILSKVTESF